MNATLTVILEDSERRELERVAWTGSAKFLYDNDPTLGIVNDIDFCSYVVFANSDMEQIVRGLRKIRPSLGHREAMAFDSVIAIAQRCSQLDRSTLTFTPFRE